MIYDYFFYLVRLEMESNRLTTTQDMFLERVGITNSFNDDNEYRYAPFFVSPTINFVYFILGSKWNLVCTCQKKRIILCGIIFK